MLNTQWDMNELIIFVLFEWAIELIEKGMAFVCHQTVEEMRGQDQKASPWRDRPIHESLRIFQVG